MTDHVARMGVRNGNRMHETLANRAEQVEQVSGECRILPLTSQDEQESKNGGQEPDSLTSQDEQVVSPPLGGTAPMGPTPPRVAAHSLRVLALGEPAHQLPDPPHWREQAACQGMDPELFFGPDDGRSESPGDRALRVDRAKRLCFSCPVRLDCLREHRDEPYGIWGGLTEVERGAVEACANGHIRTPENTRRYRGRRICADCNREAQQRWRDRVRQSYIPPHLHGTPSGYQDYGCRKPCCTEAVNESHRRRRG